MDSTHFEVWRKGLTSLRRLIQQPVREALADRAVRPSGVSWAWLATRHRRGHVRRVLPDAPRRPQEGRHSELASTRTGGLFLAAQRGLLLGH